jgi:bifunctional autolysin
LELNLDDLDGVKKTKNKFAQDFKIVLDFNQNNTKESSTRESNTDTKESNTDTKENNTNTKEQITKERSKAISGPKLMMSSQRKNFSRQSKGSQQSDIPKEISSSPSTSTPLSSSPLLIQSSSSQIQKAPEKENQTPEEISSEENSDSCNDEVLLSKELKELEEQLNSQNFFTVESEENKKLNPNTTTSPPKESKPSFPSSSNSSG